MKLFNSNFIQELFKKSIHSRNELLEILRYAAKHEIFDADGLPLIEAAIQFGDMRAKDIVLPRHEVDVIDIHATMDEILRIVKETGHSRFPVVDGGFNNVIGVFHSKDIVQYVLAPEEFKLRDYCRKALFIPDLKPLDSLLYEMRLKQSHLAIVVDEFTNLVGIVTMEMILEQIVGEIEDEHDEADDEHSIVEIEPDVYRVKAFCGLESFRDKTGILWQDDKVESVGGYIINHLGKIPASGDNFKINNIEVSIQGADSRKIISLIVKK